MTDRFNYLIVALEQDTRDDDAQPLIDAIRLMQGVADVEGNVSDYDSWTSDARAHRELGTRILKALDAEHYHIVEKPKPLRSR